MFNQAMSLDPTIAVPMFLIWIVLMIVGILGFIKKRISYKAGIFIYLISAIVAGFVLGGTPNTVAPIQQIMASIKAGSPLQVILPLVIIILIVLLTSLFVGRLFCSFACPLGQVQELISKFQFSTTAKKAKDGKRLNLGNTWVKLVRWVFFGAIIVLFGVWNIAILQLINPFLGFSVFRNPMIFIYSIPTISLIVIGITSIFIYRPWCRLLCPFGALSSLASRGSKLKLRRTEDCTDCGLCEVVCPTAEASREANKSECYLCRRCVEVCPQDAIKFTSKRS